MISLLAATGTPVSSALVAYRFTRLEWPGRDAFLAMTLATMMVPFPVRTPWGTRGTRWSAVEKFSGVSPGRFLLRKLTEEYRCLTYTHPCFGVNTER